MNRSNVNGDLKIVMGSPIPTENSLDIPPKAAGQKVIEEGVIEISAYDYDKEVLAKRDRKYGRADRGE